ncbi:hypothetical protein BHM03_00040515 [Ensete ventricosum]|nr:hypothetical protein BHM03_00040515 [Ensete ventricosum]
MGPKRELKFALESFWDGKSTADDLQKVATDLRHSIWKQMADAGIKYIPSNTFSYYDQMLDTTAMLGAVPERYNFTSGEIGFDIYFSMARGNASVPAMEMTKWFDTNYRPKAMTVFWSKMAQSMTSRPMKGMLTGPVIQIDEAALREGLPLRKPEQAFYLDWAVHSFRITNCGVQDTTQIHTHMCYSNFNDIIHSIINMDADVITIENSRSDEKLLSVFREGVKYGAGIGPGVYDIHSPRIPSTEEIADRINKMLAVLETNILWVNPDCGLKTRKYAEVKPALTNMVAAAKLLRTQLASTK